MKLNNREKTLVIFLAIVVFVGVYVQFIFFPQWDRQNELDKQRDELVQVMDDIEQYLNPQSQARRDHRNLEEEILAKSSSYFPEINQETIIIILSDMMNNAGINPGAARFSAISESVVESVVIAPKVPGNYPLRDLARNYTGFATQGLTQSSSVMPITLEKMEIGLQVQGTYAQIMAFMNEIETFSRKIHISQLDISLNQTGNLNCLMMVHIYGVPKVLDQDQDLAWSIFDLYGRNNPFSS